MKWKERNKKIAFTKGDLGATPEEMLCKLFISFRARVLAMAFHLFYFVEFSRDCNPSPHTQKSAQIKSDKRICFINEKTK